MFRLSGWDVTSLCMQLKNITRKAKVSERERERFLGIREKGERRENVFLAVHT